MKNALNWFEIPAADFDRAKSFYENILNTEMQVQDMPNMKMGFLPSEGEGSAGGAIVSSEWHKPANGGTTVYINANPDLADILSRVEAAGGKILVPKTEIGNDWGAYAVFSDSEGNMIGLHSNK